MELLQNNYIITINSRGGTLLQNKPPLTLIKHFSPNKSNRHCTTSISQFDATLLGLSLNPTARSLIKLFVALYTYATELFVAFHILLHSIPRSWWILICSSRSWRLVLQDLSCVQVRPDTEVYGVRGLMLCAQTHPGTEVCGVRELTVCRDPVCVGAKRAQ